MYTNLKILLATKHRKEEVIAPIFLNELNSMIVVPENFDTDQFGTFSGEIARKLTPKETCIEKAKQAALSHGFDYAVANEGSFGPHPYLYFIPADIEIITFIDLKNDLVITEHVISKQTNYDHKEIGLNDGYEDFLKRVMFPTHGLVIRDLSVDQVIAKGVQDEVSLKAILTKFFQGNKTKKVRLETDMRAMMNPTRMNVIREVTEQLAFRLKANCPKCQAPGFGAKSTAGKLPCKWCGSDSTLYKHIVFSCIRCNYQESQAREDGLEYAEPSQCSYCNP